MTRRRAALAGGAALALAALLAALFVQDADDYRDDLAALLRDSLGHPVSVDGALSLGWQPSPALTARDVTVSAPGAQVRIATLRVAVDSGALMARRLVPREVLAEGVDVVLAGAPLAALIDALPGPGAVDPVRVEMRDVRLRRGAAGGADAAQDGGSWLRLRRLALSELAHPEGARLELERDAPRVRGRARIAARDGALAIEQIQLDTAYGAVEGGLTLEPGGERVRIGGRLSSTALTLPAVSADRDAGPWSALDAAALVRLDADVTLRVGRLSVGDWRLNEVEVPLRVRDGVLRSSGAGVLAGGPLSVDLALSAGAGGGLVQGRLALELRQADAGDTLVMAGLHGSERGGRLDVHARLDAGGGAGLLAGLGGEIVIDARDVTLRARAAELAASDVYAGLMRMLRGDRGNRIELECVTARIAVRDGVLRSGGDLAMQSRDMNAVGGGTLSLPARTVSVLLRPWPRPGLGPSARAVAEEVEIAGALAAPEVRFRDGMRGDAEPAREAVVRRLRERARGDAPCARPGSTVRIDAWS